MDLYQSIVKDLILNNILFSTYNQVRIIFLILCYLVLLYKTVSYLRKDIKAAT